jgi:hypothetical protein
VCHSNQPDNMHAAGEAVYKIGSENNVSNCTGYDLLRLVRIYIMNNIYLPARVVTGHKRGR